MRIYAGLLACLTGMVTLLPGLAVAGKPPPSTADTTAPAAVGAIDVRTSGLALTLRFVATGDDGSSGTAARYDIFYRAGTSCTDADNPGPNPDTNIGWTRAPRSDVTAPLAAGSLEFFNVRPLQAGQPYCLALRVADEVPNWSGWRTAIGATEPGWEIGQQWPVSSVGASVRELRTVLASDAPLVTWWQGEERTAEFRGSDWQQTVPVSWPDTTWSLRGASLAANPDPAAMPQSSGLVLTQPYQFYTSTKGRNGSYITGYQVKFIEAGKGATARVAQVADGREAAGGLIFPTYAGSSVSYVRSSAGAWNPAVSLERIEQKDSSTMRTHLVVAERVGGSWSEATVLSRQDANQSHGFFEPVVVTKPDGATLAVVTPHCNVTVYAERSPLDGTWSYWAAAKALTRLRVAFDSTGQVLVFGQTGYGALDPVLLRGDDFAALGGQPAPTCADVAAPGAGVGEVVRVAPDPDLPWLFVSGVASSSGTTFLALAQGDGNNNTVEQRVLYQCARGNSWQLLRADRTHGRTLAEAVLASDGGLLRAYAWDRFARSTSLPSYTSPPPNIVYLARDGVNPCGVSVP